MSAEVLDRFLSIYNFNFLSKESRKACIHAMDAELPSKTFLIVSNPDAKDSEIQTSLIYRYPVYYGNPLFEAFHSDRLESIMGYSFGGVRLVHAARYGICGPLLTTVPNKGPLWALHVWGVNMETKHTVDFKMYESKGMPWYKERCDELIKTIFRAGQQVIERTGSLVQIRMPLVGQGQFLKMCKDADACRETFAESILEGWKLYQTNGLSLVVCDYSGMISPKHRKQLLALPYVGIERDMFDVKDCRFTTLLVNAWDPMSYIGNGGSSDYTVDGYLVAGIGPGAKIPNSSYTHNVFISKHLLDASQWVRI